MKTLRPSSAGRSLTSSNASLSRVTIPTITARTLPTNIVCLEGAQVGLAATADAPGQTHGFPLACQWQLNGTNLSGATGKALDFFATDASAGVYTLTVSNAAGATNAAWRVTLTNAINVTNDLLLIYNTNSLDSSNVCAYYLAHRPNVAGANVLGIGCTTNETFLPEEYTNVFAAQVQTWLTNNPPKRPQYVILFPDLPSRVNEFNGIDPNGARYRMDTTNHQYTRPSVSVQLRSLVADWQPFVTHLNMGDTNACCAYIDKLAWCGASNSPGQLILSASAGVYPNTNYVVDDVRFGAGYGENDYTFSSSYVSATLAGLIQRGVSSNAIAFSDATETRETNALGGGYVYYDQPHLTNCLSLAGYISWGFHSSLHSQYAVDGTVKWSGASRWWIIETAESHNGQRYGDSGNFLQWFSTNAFGGVNYTNTPVGAVTYVDEPGLEKINDAASYFGLWASGKNFGIAAWQSKKTPYFQAVGDPLVKK